jgi:hypothetical protein
MYSALKTYSTLPITKGYTLHINILMKMKTIGEFFIVKTKLFFHWALTNTFLVATWAVTNNYNPWWQQTNTSRH